MRRFTFAQLTGLLLALTLIVGIFSARIRVSAEGETRACFVIGRVNGGLSCLRNGVTNWRECTSGEAVGERDLIRTSAHGGAEVFTSDSCAVLGAGSAVRIVSTENECCLELQHGTLELTSKGGLRISVTNGNAVSVDGIAALSFDAEQMNVSVINGNAKLFNGNKVTDAAAGTAWKLGANGASATPFDGGVTKSFDIPAPDENTPDVGIGKLVVHDSFGRETDPLEVRELRVHTQVFGAVALTEIEETFFNATNRRTEGTFYFALPANASISRVAMYVGNNLVEGELVERARARQVYEEIMRQMKDPLLMEWQEGNVFRTRIFPIEPMSAKRVLISYTQELPIVDGERHYVYPLASKLTQSGTIGRFEMTAELHGTSQSDHLRTGAYADSQISFEKNLTRVSVSRNDFKPQRDFVLRFDAHRDAPMELYADRRNGEDGFFMLSYLAPKALNVKNENNKGRDVVVLVDTSLSRRADDYRAQLKVARTILEELGPNDRFVTMAFDVSARPLQNEFVSGPEAVSATVKKLNEIIPLGATNLELAIGAVDSFLATHPARGETQVVCISDGVATLGETATDSLLAKAAPLFEARHAHFHAIAMGASNNRLLLGELAGRSGGLFRTIVPGDDVQQEAFRVALALESPLEGAPKFEFKGGDVYSVYPEKGATLVAGEETIVVGRFKGSGNVNVAVRHANGETERQTFELPQEDHHNPLVSRLWAREQLNHLMLQEQTGEVARNIINLSQEFTLISPYTSFLVLENEAAYQTYGLDRNKRRRYWLELGKLNSVAPWNDEFVSNYHPKQIEFKEDAPPAKKETFSIANLDLRRIRERSSLTSGRVVATALASLTNEVYYRYLPLRSDTPRPSGSFAGAQAAPAPMPAPNSAPTSREASDIVVPPEILAKAELGDHFETINPDLPDTHGGGETVAGGGGVNGLGADDVIGVGGAASRSTGGGFGGGDGTGIGFGNGAGRGSFGNRDGGGRRLMVKRHGGSRATESAVDLGLSFIANHQLAEGSWRRVDDTALSLLAFLGAGHSQKVGMYKDNVRKGIAWLLERQKENGKISNGTYEHALATMALCEAAGMGRVPATCQAAQNAVDALVALQSKINGQLKGWGDTADTNDPIVTVWAVCALKGAKIAGLQVPPESWLGAISYVDSYDTAEKEGSDKHNERELLNVAAITLARELLCHDSHDQIITDAAARLLRLCDGQLSSPTAAYLRYLGTLALFQIGGDEWKKWNEWNKSSLIGSQKKEGDEQGSWNPEGIYIHGRKAFEDVRGKPEDEKALADALALFTQPAPTESEYEALSDALASISDVAVLKKALADAVKAPKDVQALIRTRLGYVHLTESHWADAAQEFGAAYEMAGKPLNILEGYVDALVKADKSIDALKLLLDTNGTGNTNAWVQRRIIELLAVTDYGNGTEFDATKLPVDAIQPYVQKLVTAEKYARAASELERVIQSGYHTAWAFQTLGDAYKKLKRDPDTMLRAVSSEVELFPKDTQPRIDLAQRFEVMGNPAGALEQYREAVRIKPEDPYFYKQTIERAIALSRFDVAREMLTQMERSAPAALNQFTITDGKEMVDLIRRSGKGADNKELEKEIKKLAMKDLVVILSWDTQNTDIDLHVIDPNREECWYSHQQTSCGGILDHDVTTGLGPETFALRKAPHGTFKIDIEYYAGAPETTCTIQIFRNRNSDNETCDTRKVVLKRAKERVTVDTIEIK